MSAPSDPTDQQELKQAFAATYDGYDYAAPWEAIQQYERVQETAAKHPEKGSAALSSLLDLPRGRIRTWVDGDGMPDSYRGLQTLIDQGWLPSSWDDDTMVGLAALVAVMFSGGSIDGDWHTPRVTVTDTDEQDIMSGIGRLLDIRFREVATDPRELQPATDAAILGRLLIALGAPVGDKNPESVEGLPEWLGTAPRPLQRDFARVYIHFRASDRKDRDGVQLTENRNDSFRTEFVSLLASVTGAPEDIGGESYPIYLVGNAKADLLRLPSWVE